MKGGMNNYETRVQEKRERYAALAAKKHAESDSRYNAAKAIGDFIPFGQPILVGHHSERAHRNAIDKIHSNMRKSIELDKTAAYYEDKAEGYGTHGISSDDPEAITLLKNKLADQQSAHEKIKQIAKERRAEGGETIPRFVLSNSLARINATKKRITELEAKATVEPKSASGEDWTMKEDLGENRIMFTFDSIPTEERRTALKRRGFKWSPTRGAWVRLLTGNARYSVKYLINEL